MERTERRCAKRSRYGIKWKMYAILIVFIVVTIGIVWFFQVQMLSYFYQVNKFNELENTSLLVTQKLPEIEKAEGVADEHASEYAEDIWVYKIDTVKSEADLLFDSKGTAEPISPFVASKFEKLYDKAVENGGNYIAMLPRDQFNENFELKIVKDNSGHPGDFPYIRAGADKLTAVYVTVEDVGSERYMIIQSTKLTPVSTIVDTLENQAFWIGIILSLVALVTAGFMSKLITKPIVKINKSAKALARGEYNADFSVKGYREIDELADTLDYASKELAKTDNLQKELISNISHDLRTPLTMIKGYGEVMRDIPGENTPENIQIIIDETSRLSDLVNDMLDLSKIQSGTRNADKQVFSLTQTVRETLRRYERLKMQDGYNIEFIADSDVMVMADRGMILQVIYNLINNAINYTGDDLFVSVRQEKMGDRVRISVKDTGEGIAEDQLSMIWDRYYKVDKVHKRAAVGTGIGLSIVKGILELHNASYGVQSTEGVGSVFWFELEIVDEDISEEEKDYIEADYEKQDIEQNEKDIAK